jgi:hypothetical protein
LLSFRKLRVVEAIEVNCRQSSPKTKRVVTTCAAGLRPAASGACRYGRPTRAHAQPR